MNGTWIEILRDPADIPVVKLLLGLAVGAFAAWGSGWLLPRLAEVIPSRFRNRVLTLVPALRLLIGLVVIVWAVPQVIAPTPQNLVAVLGALGIALGFAFKDYAASLVAGVVAVAERPYRQGDWVRIGPHYGEVRRVGSRAIQLVTADDDVVTVPHGRLWTDDVANANDGARTLQVDTEVWLHPDHDAEAVRARLLEVAWTAPRLDVARPVVVTQQEHAWATCYFVRAYPLDARDQFLFRTDVAARAKAALRALGCRFVAWPPAPDGGAANPTHGGATAAGGPAR